MQSKRAVYDTQVCIIKKTCILSGFVILISLLGRETSVALGFIFGTLIGILNFRLLAISLIKSAKFPQHRAQVYIAIRYLLRYGILFIVLFSAAQKGDPRFFFGTVGGLLIIKLAVFWDVFKG